METTSTLYTKLLVMLVDPGMTQLPIDCKGFVY